MKPNGILLMVALLMIEADQREGRKTRAPVGNPRTLTMQASIGLVFVLGVALGTDAQAAEIIHHARRLIVRVWILLSRQSRLVVPALQRRFCPWRWHVWGIN